MKDKQPPGPDAASRGRRTGRPSLEQVEEIERRLLETATTLYLRDGPAVTMKAIVQASGLSSKTVYARYANKDTLFLAVLRSLLRNARPPVDLEQADRADVGETLRAFILGALQGSFRTESVTLHRMLSIDPSFGRQVGPDIFETVDRILLDPLTSYLERMAAAARIRPVDVQRTARALTSLIIAEPASRKIEGRPPPTSEEMAERADFLSDLFFRGLRP